MSKIFVVKRRAGIEHPIRVWNLGGFIETEQVAHSVATDKLDALEAILSVEEV